MILSANKSPMRNRFCKRSLKGVGNRISNSDLLNSNSMNRSKSVVLQKNLPFTQKEFR